jgi:hypothetical protein
MEVHTLLNIGLPAAMGYILKLQCLDRDHIGPPPQIGALIVLDVVRPSGSNRSLPSSAVDILDLDCSWRVP